MLPHTEGKEGEQNMQWEKKVEPLKFAMESRVNSPQAQGHVCLDHLCTSKPSRAVGRQLTFNK